MAGIRPGALFRTRDRLEDLSGLTSELLARELLRPAALPAALHAQGATVEAALALLAPELRRLHEQMGPELARLDREARRLSTEIAA